MTERRNEAETSGFVTRWFSVPIFKYTLRNNLVLMIVIIMVFCMFTGVTNVAASLISVEKTGTISEETREEFMKYLGVLAITNLTSGSDLSYEDFISGEDLKPYEAVFDAYNSSSDEDELTTEGFDATIRAIEDEGADPDTYVRLFEYAFEISGKTGVFTGEEMELQDMLETIMGTAGISMDDLERMQDMDFSSMITRIYFTGMGVLILFLFVIIASNGLIAAQVDRGSMAYLLAAPNDRRAIAITQMIYLLIAPAIIAAIGCAVRIGSTKILFGEVVTERLLVMYLGLYILAEAVGSICFLSSCIFNESSKSLALGGGFGIWCFLASLLGIFGSRDLLDMGMGVEELSVFNKLTLVGLYDLDALKTIGTDDVNMDFVPKLVILAVIALIAYIAGIRYFRKKDLPL